MTELRLITGPGVYVLARQSIDHGELTRFLHDTGFPHWTTDSPCDGESVVEIAGRVCYRSFNGGRKHDDYVRHILEVGHGSVCEHAVWTLLITGVSRTLTHELVRHRIGLSPSQESQRYVDASGVAFVVPPRVLAEQQSWERDLRFGGHCPDYADWLSACSAALNCYLRLLGPPSDRMDREKRKQITEAARSVLPGCAETRIALTGNARAMRNLVELRASKHADAEIRRLGCAILDVMQREAPNLFADYQRTPLPDGTFDVTTPHRKV
jgi:thymidylate synthase (FAD)